MRANESYREAAADPRLSAMLGESLQMMEELSDLTRKLAGVSKDATESTEGRDRISGIEEEFKVFQARLVELTREGRKVAAQLDVSVRKNPYVYMAAAIGLGFLLGKAKRL